MTLASLVGSIIGLINTIIPVLVTIALVIFFIGLIRYIYKSSDAHGHGADKDLILWGLIALFVLVSVWGILAIVRESLNLY